MFLYAFYFVFFLLFEKITIFLQRNVWFGVFLRLMTIIPCLNARRALMLVSNQQVESRGEQRGTTYNKRRLLDALFETH